MIVSTKKYASLLIIFVLLFSLGGTALAAGGDSKSTEPGSIGVQWVNTNLVDINLSFDGSRGICGACVMAKSGTTEITGKAELARKNSNGTYTTIKTWSDLKASDYILTFDGTYYVTTGYTYRLTFTAVVYRNGISETVSGYYEAYAK